MNIGGGRATGEQLLGLRTPQVALEAIEAQMPRTVAIKADDVRYQYIRAYK